MRDKHKATAISLLLLVIMAVFAIHLMAHVFGVYEDLGLLSQAMVITSAAVRRRIPRTHLTWECPKCGWVYNEDGSCVEASKVIHPCPARDRKPTHLRPQKGAQS